MQPSQNSFFTNKDSGKGEKEAIFFDPSKLKAFVKAGRRTSSSAERAQSDSNSDLEMSRGTLPQLPKAK